MHPDRQCTDDKQQPPRELADEPQAPVDATPDDR